MSGVYDSLLRLVGRDKTSRLIADYMETPSRSDQLHIIDALGEVGDARSIEALTAFAASHYRLALRAIDALDQLLPSRVEPSLLRFAVSQDTEVSLVACEWLASNGSARALPVLEEIKNGVRPPPELSQIVDEAILRIEKRIATPKAEAMGRLTILDHERNEGDLSFARSEGDLSINE